MHSRVFKNKAVTVIYKIKEKRNKEIFIILEL